MHANRPATSSIAKTRLANASSNFILSMNNLACSNDMIFSFGLKWKMVRTRCSILYRIIHSCRSMIYAAIRAGYRGANPLRHACLCLTLKRPAAERSGVILVAAALLLLCPPADAATATGVQSAQPLRALRCGIAGKQQCFCCKSAGGGKRMRADLKCVDAPLQDQRATA